MKFFILAVATIVFSNLAVAKDKENEAPWKYHECRWLQRPIQEMCNGRPYAKGFVQCGGFIVTGYCPFGAMTNMKDCLEEDSGATKDCYQKSLSPFTDRLKQQGKNGVVRAPTCVWDAGTSFLPANDIDVAQDCNGEKMIYRRASCDIGTEHYEPMLYCRLAGSSDTARACLADENNPSIQACRRSIEAVLQGNQYQIMNGVRPTSKPSAAKP